MNISWHHIFSSTKLIRGVVCTLDFVRFSVFLIILTSHWFAKKNTSFHGKCPTKQKVVMETHLKQHIYLEPQTTIYKWMFGETTIFYIKIWNHPIEPSICRWLALGFQVVWIYWWESPNLQTFVPNTTCLPLIHLWFLNQLETPKPLQLQCCQKWQRKTPRKLPKKRFRNAHQEWTPKTDRVFVVEL